MIMNEMVLTIIQTSKETMMFIEESDRLLKRIIQKKLSIDIAIRAKIFAEANYPDDKKFIDRMVRQINCNNKLRVMNGGRVLAKFCGQKTCYICNSVRLVKFIKKYLNAVKGLDYKYNLVLTARNPGAEKLAVVIDKMFNFFKNSGLLKNKVYKSLNKKIKMIRSFECTLNEKRKTFNVHFHMLVAGNVEEDVKSYCELLIEYWLKYFEEDANEAAQYMAPMKKSELENFKYLLKLKDITEGNMFMFYQLIKALEGRRLFTAKNITGIKNKKDVIEELNKEKDKNNSKIIHFYYYSDKKKCFYESITKDVFNMDTLKKEAEEIKIEKKNLREISDYLNKASNDLLN